MKIISGAQTGADRGALDAAIELELPYGGYVPKGRLAEDGRIPDRYEHLIETPENTYPPRTELNIIHSDATVLFTLFTPGMGGPGSRLTASLARQHNKPVLPINIAKVGILDAAAQLKDFIGHHKVETLNVAGSRESSMPGIQALVKAIVKEALKP